MAQEAENEMYSSKPRSHSVSGWPSRETSGDASFGNRKQRRSLPIKDSKALTPTIRDRSASVATCYPNRSLKPSVSSLSYDLAAKEELKHNPELERMARYPFRVCLKEGNGSAT